MGSQSQHIPKRLICCADGTWLAANVGSNEVPSNVAKLARALSTEGIDENGQVWPQLVQYQSGLGSASLPFERAIAGGMGIGLSADICQMYDFLANNYNEGDELFFFGFSRGAYTVRSVAGLVCDAGILPAVQMKHFHEMWKAYRHRGDNKPFADTRWYRDHKDMLQLRQDVQIKVVGVWETVGSLGIPQWPLVKLAAHIGLDLNWQFAFHNTKLSPNIKHAFQALALDERRLVFPPAVMRKLDTNATSPELHQCWFPGVHANVGGQSEMIEMFGDSEEIGYNTLAWMIDNVAGMLTFTNTEIDELVEEHSIALSTVDGRINRHSGWGSGPFLDNFWGPVGLFFRLLGKEVRTPGAYYDNGTQETIHPIVRIRRQKVIYQPESLQGFELRESKEGYTYQKTYQKGAIAVPEARLSDKRVHVRLGKNGNTRFDVRASSLSRELCPEPILKKLDQADQRLEQQAVEPHLNGKPV